MTLYYLLKNPIHTREFDKFYRFLTEIKTPSLSLDSDRTIFTDSINHGYLNSETTTVYSNERDKTRRFTVPPYSAIMGKYCNAFKLNAEPLNNGLASEIYLDPVCSMALEKLTGEISFILGKNYTQECLTYDYWRTNKSVTDYQIVEESKAAQTILRTQTGLQSGIVDANTPQWPCENQAQTALITPLEWLRTVSKNLNRDSDSFINTLANSYINKHGKQFVTMEQRINWDNTVPNADNDIQPPHCAQLPGRNIILCQQIFDIGGNFLNNDLSGLYQVCGGTEYNVYNSDPVDTDASNDQTNQTTNKTNLLTPNDKTKLKTSCCVYLFELLCGFSCLCK